MLTRRLLQLFIGLAMYGISLAMFIRAGLGLDPWDVFHQGVAGRTGLSIGTVVVIVSFLVLLLWIPLRQWPGFGTLCNAVLVGVFADVGLALIPAFSHLGGQIGMLGGAVLLNGIASACYIGARFGPGARDGLMTGPGPAHGLVRADRPAPASKWWSSARAGCWADRSAWARWSTRWPSGRWSSCCCRGSWFRQRAGPAAGPKRSAAAKCRRTASRQPAVRRRVRRPPGVRADAACPSGLSGAGSGWHLGQK